jgi:hypothetical protein
VALVLWLGLAGRLDAQASWSLRTTVCESGELLWSVTDLALVEAYDVPNN